MERVRIAIFSNAPSDRTYRLRVGLWWVCGCACQCVIVPVCQLWCADGGCGSRACRYVTRPGFRVGQMVLPFPETLVDLESLGVTEGAIDAGVPRSSLSLAPFRPLGCVMDTASCSAHSRVIECSSTVWLAAVVGGVDHAAFSRLKEVSKELATEAELIRDLDFAAIGQSLEDLSAHYTAFAAWAVSDGRALIGEMGIPPALLSADGERFHLVRKSVFMALSAAVPGAECGVGALAKVSTFSLDPEVHKSWPALSHAASALVQCIVGAAPHLDTEGRSGCAVVWCPTSGVRFGASSVGLSDVEMTDLDLPGVGEAVDLGSLDPLSVNRAVLCAIVGTAADHLGGGGAAVTDETVVDDGSTLSFARPFTKLANGRHRVNLRSKLLCFKQLVATPLDPTIAATLLGHPAAVVLGWLGRLKNFQTTTTQLRQVGAISKSNIVHSMWFQPGALVSMVTSLGRMRQLISKTSEADRGAVLFYCSPVSFTVCVELGAQYSALITSSPLAFLGVLQRV